MVILFLLLEDVIEVSKNIIFFLKDILRVCNCIESVVYVNARQVRGGKNGTIPLSARNM